MDRQEQGSYEITSDGKTVWVNHELCGCVGRFSLRGMELYARQEDLQPFELVRVRAKFTSRQLTRADWLSFVEDIEIYHKVKIDPDLLAW